jgi:putative ABC transport system substrate-binding protein
MWPQGTTRVGRFGRSTLGGKRVKRRFSHLREKCRRARRTAENRTSAEARSIFRARVNRRVLLLGGTSAAVFVKPGFGAGQIRRLGFIAPGLQGGSQNLLASFHDGLTALGWIHGHNIIVLDRWGEELSERLTVVAKELIGSGVDILVTVGTAATLAARSISLRTPIVFASVGDPVAVGVVNSLTQPGGNATGLTLNSVPLVANRFQLLQELLPGLRRVAVLVRDEPGREQRMLEIRGIANRMRIDLVEFVAPTGRALELTFRWLRSEPSDALYVASGPLGPAKRAELIALAAQARMPAIYPFRVFAVAGGLMSLAPDEHYVFRRAAVLVDQILRGSDPARIPVEEPTNFELLINLRTASELGLAVPQSILARANQVIQ